MNYIAYPDLATNAKFRGFIGKFLREKNISKVTNTPEYFFTLIYNKLGITKEDLQGRTRKREIVMARHVFIYLLRNSSYKNSLAYCGMQVNRDHATALYSIRNCINVREFKELVEFVLK